ncbi:MAG: hypothetical protein HQ553_05850 [Chloroflexi bacterium]|nr:hypothetical protein [Chloroflexota bacterium]
MRTEKEIEELRNELSRMIDYVADFGSEKDIENEDVDFAHDVLDVIDWVLGEIETEDFKVEPYLNMAGLEEIVSSIGDKTEGGREED